MRAWELFENTRPPQYQITLRGLHKMKKQAKGKAQEDQERFDLMRLMYGNTGLRREQLELERLELEMAQLRAETAAIEAEAASKSSMALHKNAKSGITATAKRVNQVTKTAKSGLDRQLKV